MLYRLLLRLGRKHKAALLFVFDIWLAAMAFLVAAFLSDQTGAANASSTIVFAIVLTMVAVGLLITRLHWIQLNHYVRRAILTTFLIGGSAASAGYVASLAFGGAFDAGFFLLFWMAFALLSLGGRLLLREIVVASYRRQNGALRVLVYGSGQTGQQLVAALQTDNHIRPVGFIDDDRSRQGAMISGLRVFPPDRLEDRIEAMQVDRIVLAMPSLSDVDKAAIARRLSHLACEVHVMPSLETLLVKPQTIASTAPLDFANFLGRSNLDAVLPATREMYVGKTVLITGAGGSIGSEICLQVAASEPRKVVLLDHSEYLLYQVQRKLEAQYPEVEIAVILGSVCEPALVEHVFATESIDVVFHAAAYKHLPMLEDNVIEGMRNNVYGTRVVAMAAMTHGAESFILISTDKAVRPTSWLGYSKRLSELVVQDLATRSTDTRMSMVRFGNVLGSSGSVIPLFQEQIARGGPVTLTHPDVTRYFMTVSEAVRLVLLAGSFARGGDVFVLDMGKPVPIRRLARNLIEASGYTVRDAANPTGDIELLVTGLRPGEKISEELLMGSDMLTTMHPKILRATEPHPSALEMATMLSALNDAIVAYDQDAVRALVREMSLHIGCDAHSILQEKEA